MDKEFYTWEQVRAYGAIAVHNLLNSGNELNMKNFMVFIDPLQTLYGKDGVIGMSEYIEKKYEK